MFGKLVIKNYDTRCSTKCIQNWIQYKQKPPIGFYCKCNCKYYFNYNLKYCFNMGT